MDELFLEMYQLYKRQIYVYLYRLTLDQNAADELTQETFFRAYRFRDGFRQETSLKNWLHKIALNTYRSWRGKHRVEDELTETFPDPLDQLEGIDTKVLIHTILSHLGETDRLLLTLRFTEDCSYGSIQEITGMSENQVKVGLYRAKNRFRAMHHHLTGGDYL